MSVALVGWIDRHCRIAQHRFWTGCRHHKVSLSIAQWITQVPERSLFFLLYDLEIGYGRVELWIPIYQPVTAVDQPLFVQADENTLHCAGQPRIHSEALPLPVRRGTESPQLLGNSAARLFFPVPDSLNERLSPETLPRDAFRFELSLNHHLRCNARMIRADLP